MGRLGQQGLEFGVLQVLQLSLCDDLGGFQPEGAIGQRDTAS
ncbi:MAG: hypothetical protein Q4D96_10870 [Propionibacteriaceae bacterium]|nr:hypothetical protein [Propionibacteriaceae bacterium]